MSEARAWTQEPPTRPGFFWIWPEDFTAPVVVKVNQCYERFWTVPGQCGNSEPRECIEYKNAWWLALATPRTKPHK